MTLFKKPDQRKIEGDHRSRLLQITQCISKDPLSGWNATSFAIGGLLAVGFSKHYPSKLVCLSSQAASLIDCESGDLTFLNIPYEEDSLTTKVPLLEEEILLAGIHGGGLLTSCTQGDHVELLAPAWPKQMLVFCPSFTTWLQVPEQCTILVEEYEFFAYGFSYCGKYLVAATSSTLYLYQRRK